MKRRYTVVLERDSEGDGYTITVPALPGCISEADTIEESLEMAKDAIEGHIESLLALGQSPGSDVADVSLDVSQADEILIYKVDIEVEPGVVPASWTHTEGSGGGFEKSRVSRSTAARQSSASPSRDQGQVGHSADAPRNPQREDAILDSKTSGDKAGTIERVALR